MPLIGAQGPGSNISWRGNLDEYPDFFEFPQIIDAEIGVPITSIAQTITGINYKALVTAVGSGASVSVNGGEFLDGNDENNWIIIRNEDVIQLQIRTQDTDSRFDFNKTYNVNVTVGKRDASWSVISKRLDDTPDDFSFVDSLNNEVNTLITSNEVTVTGIDEDLGVDILVKSPTGTLFINGVNVGRSAKIKNNDTLYLQNTTSNFYETDVDTIIQLGTFETTWKIRTRVANKTVNAFNLGSVLDVNRNTIQISNTITIAGPDPNINGNNPLQASILGANGEFRVVRGGVEIRGYSAEPFTVQTGDQITVKAVASNDFDTTIVASLTISQTVGGFSIETRPTPIKTFPSQFNFVDRTGVERTNTLTPPENRIDSAPITLTGMTTATNDFGTASITGNGGDGSRAQFKVVRNGQTVRDFGIANFQVRNGDEITLRIISSPNSLGSVQAVFTVTGIDTNNVIAGVAGSTSDTWVVTSAQRFCNITTFSFEEETGATPDVAYTRSFVAQGFDKDCRCTVTTSDTANSFLRVGDRTGTSLEVNLGDTVTVSLICPYFDSTRSTTVTLSSSFSTQQSAVFKVTPKPPPLPELTIDADPRNPEFIFPVGGSTVLTYTYDFVTNPAVVTNFGVTTVTTPKGSGTVNRTNLTESITYSITVSNSTGSTTKTVQVLVGDPPTPTISLCPSNTSSCPAVTNVVAGSPVTLFWRSTFATSVTSPDFNTGNQQNGSITVTPTVDNKVYSISATGPGGTVTATQQINLTPTVTLTVNPSTITNGSFTGATLTWNSNLATRVVSTNGFFASGPSGSINVNPTVTTTYSITVADDEGITATATARLTVEDDRTVDSFSFNPSSFTERETGEVVVSEPSFSVGGSSVSGLSPGISVTANVSGTGAQFESGGTSKTVQNGTSTSTLRVSLTNSPNRNEQRTATLNINGVSASFTSKTKACTVNETTGTIDNSITIKLRQAPALNSFIGYAIEGGTGNVPRTTASNGEQIFTSSGTFTPPAGITRVKIEAIGGGGGGCSGRDCSTRSQGVGGGGGAATTTEIDVVPGNNYGVSIGAGGAGFTLGSANSGGTTTSTTTEQVDKELTITTNGCDEFVGNNTDGTITNCTAQNCGDPNVPTDCKADKGRRYYSIRVNNNISNQSCTWKSNSDFTAGGLDTSKLGSITLKQQLKDTNGEFLFWFCRNDTNNKGTTHVREFVVRVKGTRQKTTTTTTTGTTNFGGANGGTTRVTDPSRRVVASAAGGTGGGWNSTTRVPGSGGSPNGGNASTTAGGGGSGKLDGRTNSAGSSLTGGTGEQFGGSTSAGSGPSGSGCSRSGGSGGAYGAGGGGGNGADGGGGNGASGAVRFSWVAPATQSFTYSQVVTEIFSAFWSKGSRGPTLNEIQTWVNNFKNSASTYPDLASLSNAITVQNLGPTPPVDNCGDAIPRFP